MFTGIVEELGRVKSIGRRGKVTLIEIAADKALAETKIGDSIAVNGVCLTVVKIGNGAFSFEVMPQTLKNTNLGLFKVQEKVNLERSLKVGDRISGHFVTGHVDCIGVVRKKEYVGGNLAFEIAVSAQYLKYCLPKGSICVDGISLTLVSKSNSTFTIYIIPHTSKNTTLNSKGPSDKLNIEFDILAKK